MLLFTSLTRGPELHPPTSTIYSMTSGRRAPTITAEWGSASRSQKESSKRMGEKSGATVFRVAGARSLLRCHGLIQPLSSDCYSWLTHQDEFFKLREELGGGCEVLGAGLGVT